MSYTYGPIPFVVPGNRERITEEPDRHGIGQNPDYPRAAEWLGMENLGGGRGLPDDYMWPTNPKQELQEEGGYG